MGDFHAGIERYRHDSVVEQCALYQCVRGNAVILLRTTRSPPFCSFSMPAAELGGVLFVLVLLLILVLLDDCFVFTQVVVIFKEEKEVNCVPWLDVRRHLTLTIDHFVFQWAHQLLPAHFSRTFFASLAAFLLSSLWPRSRNDSRGRMRARTHARACL